MKRITLLFPDTRSLWGFARTLQRNNIAIDSSRLTLNCECSEDDISRALLEFKAKILEETEDRRSKK